MAQPWTLWIPTQTPSGVVIWKPRIPTDEYGQIDAEGLAQNLEERSVGGELGVSVNETVALLRGGGGRRRGVDAAHALQPEAVRLLVPERNIVDQVDDAWLTKPPADAEPEVHDEFAKWLGRKIKKVLDEQRARIPEGLTESLLTSAALDYETSIRVGDRAYQIEALAASLKRVPNSGYEKMDTADIANLANDHSIPRVQQLRKMLRSALTRPTPDGDEEVDGLEIGATINGLLKFQLRVRRGYEFPEVCLGAVEAAQSGGYRFQVEQFQDLQRKTVADLEAGWLLDKRNLATRLPAWTYLDLTSRQRQARSARLFDLGSFELCARLEHKLMEMTAPLLPPPLNAKAANLASLAQIDKAMCPELTPGHPLNVTDLQMRTIRDGHVSRRPEEEIFNQVAPIRLSDFDPDIAPTLSVKGGGRIPDRRGDDWRDQGSPRHGRRFSRPSRSHRVDPWESKPYSNVVPN